jgi:hypothetical protein
MICHRLIAATAVMVLVAASDHYALDKTITGAAKVKLSGPITQEQIDQCKSDAKCRLKPQLLRWLEETKEISVDTTDVLTNLLFDGFLDSCVIRAKETSAFKEKYWTFSYTLMPEDVDAALAAFDDRIELLAIHAWKRLENALTQKNYEEIYYQSVSVIAYAAAYMGSLLTVPNDSNKLLLEEGRAILTGFLKKLYITSSGQIIEGKPGYPPRNPPTMAVTIDGNPFAGLGLTGFIPGGVDVFTGVADNTGMISYGNLIIPFVKNGSMMYVQPNLGRVINSKWRVGMKDFGIKIGNDLSQIYFFKIDKPTFALTFEAIATDPTDTLPREFMNGNSIKKHLIDSCWLLPASAGGGQPDLIIVIKCQISSASSETIEAGLARFEGTVLVQAPQLTPPRAESEVIDFEKKYEKLSFDLTDKKSRDRGPRVPLGSFVWECNIKLRSIIRGMLNKL